MSKKTAKKLFTYPQRIIQFIFLLVIKEKIKNNIDMELKQEWKNKGYIDEPVKEGTDLKAEIRRLCKEKNAIVLAHYYTVGEIQEVAEIVTPEKNARDWYYALMDYGTYLKKEKKVKNSQSAHYVKQKKFKGSRRFVRGGIVKLLVENLLSFRELLN